jgi:hypothetical protein
MAHKASLSTNNYNISVDRLGLCLTRTSPSLGIAVEVESLVQKSVLGAGKHRLSPGIVLARGTVRPSGLPLGILPDHRTFLGGSAVLILMDFLFYCYTDLVILTGQ